MGKFKKMNYRALFVLTLLLTCSCSTKNENQVDNFSINLIESTNFSMIYNEIEESEKLIIDSIVSLYIDSLKSRGDTSFIDTKIEFRKGIYNKEGYLFNKVGYCPHNEFIPDKPLPILGEVDMKDTLDVLNRLNNPRIRKILKDTLKWYYDFTKINDKEVYTLLLVKNNQKGLILDIKYVDCINLNEDKDVIVEFGGKAYYIKIKMNDKFKKELRSFPDNQYYIIKIKILNDYFYFYRTIKQLKENNEFHISHNASKSQIRKIKNEFSNYKNIICP